MLTARAIRAGLPYDLILSLSPGQIIGVIHEHHAEMHRTERASDFRHAALQACLCNIHRKKGTKPFTFADFLDLTESEENAITEQAFLNHFQE